MKAAPIVAVCLVILELSAGAFGPEGHELVGAVADQRLAGTAAGREVASILGGVSLARAATLPDELKSWDEQKPQKPPKLGGFPNEKLIAELWQFWRANSRQAPGDPSHSWFHYTDVPVEQNLYDDGTRGRTEWDVVRMIPRCVEVLRGGAVDEKRKITKAVALILLAHYVGDLHQPLHVGAQYFDRTTFAKVDGDKDKTSLETQGGNSLMLHYTGSRGEKMTAKLHTFWDSAAVSAGVRQVGAAIEADIKNAGAEVFARPTHAQIVYWLAVQAPPKWQPDSPTDNVRWTKNRADEMLPLARLAHARLRFEALHVDEKDAHLVRGMAYELPDESGKSYLEAAGGILAANMQTAGWRLAEVLQSIWK